MAPEIPSTSNPQALALSAREAAAALAISPRTLWQLTNQGLVPHVRLSRRVVYPVDGLREFLQSNTKGGAV